jgi:predicted transcriptional regulator
VYDAIKMMADKDVGALVMLDASKIVGIVTEQDYARNVTGGLWLGLANCDAA